VTIQVKLNKSVEQYFRAEFMSQRPNNSKKYSDHINKDFDKLGYNHGYQNNKGCLAIFYT